MKKQVWNESNRKKGVCNNCGIFKPIKARNMCQNCWHKYKHRHFPNFFLRQKHSQMNERCRNPNKNPNTIKCYFGRVVCELEDFLNRFLNDEIFLKLYKQWQDSNYEYKLCPSIDRINPDLDYVIENLQFITMSENCTKDQILTPINVYKSKTREHVGRFSSINEALRQLNCNNLYQANICKCLAGTRKTAGGYIFEYA